MSTLAYQLFAAQTLAYIQFMEFGMRMCMTPMSIAMSAWTGPRRPRPRLASFNRNVPPPTTPRSRVHLKLVVNR